MAFKTLVAASAITALTLPAFAGSLTAPVVEEPIIIPEAVATPGSSSSLPLLGAGAGGAGAVVAGLAVLGLVALAAGDDT